MLFGELLDTRKGERACVDVTYPDGIASSIEAADVEYVEWSSEERGQLQEVEPEMSARGEESRVRETMREQCGVEPPE